MLARPDPQSFTRFFVSLGAFLCITAFLAPALVLRETKVLQITRQDLAALTPAAKKEIERRQRIAEGVGAVAPYAGLVLLIGGVAVLWYATPRLRRQEEADDQRAAAELQKLNAELAPQTEADLNAGARDEAETELVAEVRAAAASPTSQPPIFSRSVVGDRAKRYQEVEARVLRRIAEITPASYDLRAQVKITGHDGSQSLRLDGVLRSRGDGNPDIVVEIKLISGTSLRNSLQNRLDEAIARLIRYRRRADPRAHLWMIMIAEQPLPTDAVRRVREATAEVRDLVTISLLQEPEVDGLPLPKFTSPPST